MSTATLPSSRNRSDDDLPAAVDAHRAPPARNRAGTEACPQCGSTQSWGIGSWCPECGYYPALGTSVVDPTEPAAKASPDAEPEGPLWQQVPSWIYVLACGLLVVIVVSVAARLLLGGSPYRSLWSTAQLAVGLICFLVGHISAYLYACSDNDRITPFDIYMKPFAVWRSTMRALPRQARRLYLAVWGLAAAKLALVVIGGVELVNPLDLIQVAPKAQDSLVQQIVRQARKQQGDADSLEDAMNQFVGEAEEGGLGSEQDEADKKLADEELLTVDCLIIGYTSDGPKDFSSLLLASTVDGKLRFVGSLSDRRVPDEARRELMRRMTKLHTSRPFVKTTYSATWLRPVLMCRVSYTDWTPNKRLREPFFQELLADVELDR